MSLFNLRTFIKTSLEYVRRLFNQKEIFSFKYDSQNVRFFLPFKGDHIQQQIIIKNTFYEEMFLKKIKPLISSNMAILDIGSNIGNHAIFFAKILKAKRVICFEPNKQVYDVLLKNIRINKLSERISAFNLALGSKFAEGKMEIRDKNNCGTGKVVIGGSEFKIVPLDSLKIKEKISFIKIDVEGFEPGVLMGAKKLIKKNLPIVWVEINPLNIKFVTKYFKELGYRDSKILDKENYLFFPKKLE